MLHLTGAAIAGSHDIKVVGRPRQVSRVVRRQPGIYDEPALAVLVLNIALINCWNRINATTRQVAGSVHH